LPSVLHGKPFDDEIGGWYPPLEYYFIYPSPKVGVIVKRACQNLDFHDSRLLVNVYDGNDNKA
jgi:hypothetical protein